MAYLAFRVFPHRRDDSEAIFHRTAPHAHRERMITAKYRFEDFPCCSDSTYTFERRESGGSYTSNSTISDHKQETIAYLRRSAER
jgi:hypothetical protein